MLKQSFFIGLNSTLIWKYQNFLGKINWTVCNSVTPLNLT